MIFKERSKPFELLVLEFLNNRMRLPDEWLKKLANRQKGHRGELKLDPHTTNLGKNFVVVNDVRLPTPDKSSHFQIDTLLIEAHTAHIYEVKNHSGRYYVENGLFYTNNHYEVLDPFFQIGKTATFLRQHLHSLRMNFKVETHLVFIDPTFMLYQAPKHLSFLLHGHLESHFENLRHRQQPFHPQQLALAQYATENHLFRVKNEDVPKYNYHDLRKGIACAACGSLQTYMQNYSCLCQKCSYREKASYAIHRSIEEFRILFPERTLTTEEIHKWCLSPSMHQIRRVLRKHYVSQGNTRGTFYQ